MEETKLIFLYINVWNWFIISILFLISALIIISTSELAVLRITLFTALIIMFGISFFNSLRNQIKLKKIFNEND
jgi:hypothetical protein